jgi:hypothetical protein
MPIRRTIHAYRAATPFEQAGWTLGFVAAAVAVPAVLRWVLGSIAAAGRGEPGLAAEAGRLAVHATGVLVQWLGMGILGALGLLCAWSAVAYARGWRGRGTGIPGWAIAETYALAAAAAFGGLLWLAASSAAI